MVGHTRCRTPWWSRQPDIAAMDSRRTDSIVLQLLDAEQAVSQSLAVVCATTPPSRPNTGELLRVSEVLDVAGIAVKRAITIRRRRRLDEAQHTERAAMADAEAMTARRAPYRAITDSRGVTWDVFAVHSRRRAQADQGVFQAGVAVLRVGRREAPSAPDSVRLAVADRSRSRAIDTRSRDRADATAAEQPASRRHRSAAGLNRLNPCTDRTRRRLP
jgi:hypothetical protein